MPGTLQLCHLGQGRTVEPVAGPCPQGLRLHFSHLSRELPTPWWWEPWPSWTSAWRSCSPSSSPKAPAWPNSGFSCCLFTPLTCLFSLFLLLLVFSPIFSFSFLFCLPLFLSLAFLSCSPFRFSHLFWICFCLPHSLSQPNSFFL